MIWASWRRQRAQLITLLGVLVVGAGVIALLRSIMLGMITSSQLAQCVTQALNDCAAPAEAQKAFREEWGNPLDIGRIVIVGLPALIGVFIGAPLFARELEQGTHVLAFTQSVSRTQWLFSKLVIALVPALVVLIALQSLVSWWLSAAGTLGPRMNGPFHTFNFDIENVSPVGYTLFAFALGVFVGVAFRNSLAAMTATFGGFVVVRLALSGLADHLVPLQHVEAGPATPLEVHQNGSLVLDDGWLDTASRPIPTEKANAILEACKMTPSGASNTQEGWLACLPQSGLGTRYADIIPPSQVWQVHLADFSIYGVLAVLLLAGSVWVLRRQG